MRSLKVAAVLCVVALFVAGSAFAQQMSNPYGPNIGLDAAKKVAAAAAKEAANLKINICTAIVDTGGNLVYFERFDVVQWGSIEVAIHNHGPGDKIYPTPESIYQKVEKLDPRIGLCIDVGHTLRIGADPVADSERFADRLLDLHIKDVTAAAPEGQTLEIGRGVIDIPALLRTLIKIKYARIVSFEYEKDENDPLAGLAESVGYIRGALAAIG